MIRNPSMTAVEMRPHAELNRCPAAYDATLWIPRPCREPAGHDGCHVDQFGRTWGGGHPCGDDRRSR